MAEPLGILILGAGIAHHNEVVAELHGGMIDLAIRLGHRGAELAETESL